MLKQLILTTILLLPILVSAQDPAVYKTLVGIPGIENGQGDFQSFINSLYAISISLAAVLAVIKIIIAGVKYMLTDIVTSKGEAKKDIKGALLGLLVVLGAVLILSVINPQLVNIDVNLERVEAPPAVTIASDNLSVEIQPGDSFFSAPDEEACTSVDSSACAEGKQYACYKGEWLAEKNVCVVRKKDKVKGGVDIDMWTARVDGVASIKGTQSGEYGHITQQEVSKIPRGAFLGTKDNYDDTGTWDLCNDTGDQNRFYLRDTAVTKIRTCAGKMGGCTRCIRPSPI